MSITIKDIAKLAGCAPSTVSRVLNGKSDEYKIGQEVQERIRDAVKSTNYRLNARARGLRSDHSGVIGLILPSMSDSFYSQVAQTISLEADRKGYALMIGCSESFLDRENRLIDAFKSQQVDGLIIAPTKYSDVKVKELLKEDFPFVLFDRYWQNLETNFITINNEEVTYSLTMRLIKEGARKIAILLTNPHLKIMEKRLNGYRRALFESDILFDENLVGIIDFQSIHQGMSSVINSILENNPDLDSILFVTHVLAMDTFTYLRQAGIPLSRFGMACIHDIPVFKLLVPQMITAKMPMEQIGRNAVRLLLQNIVEKGEKRKIHKESIILNCELS